jgi:hypothetical protein
MYKLRCVKDDLIGVAPVSIVKAEQHHVALDLIVSHTFDILTILAARFVGHGQPLDSRLLRCVHAEAGTIEDFVTDVDVALGLLIAAFELLSIRNLPDVTPTGSSESFGYFL